MTTWGGMVRRSGGKEVRKEDLQEIEISIKGEHFVAFWRNTIKVLNKTANQQRKITFLDEKKLTKEDVIFILKKFGLDVTSMSLIEWDEDNRWDFSAYKEAKYKEVLAFTVNDDGSVKPRASCKVRKQDGYKMGYIHILCGPNVHNYQSPLPYGISSDDWIQGFNEWEKRLPTFKSMKGFNVWKHANCDITDSTLVLKMQDYYQGLVEGSCYLTDSDIEQEVLGLEPNLSYHLSRYQQEKERYCSDYPAYYERCDYYISELSKSLDRLNEFYDEYEERNHPAFEKTPPRDEIYDILTTFSCYRGAKKEALECFTDEYIAEHFKL